MKAYVTQVTIPYPIIDHQGTFAVVNELVEIINYAPSTLIVNDKLTYDSNVILFGEPTIKVSEIGNNKYTIYVFNYNKGIVRFDVEVK